MPTRLRHPQTTVRWRLTLLYGGLFLVCGAALLAITYGLVAHATTTPRPNFVHLGSPARDFPSGSSPRDFQTRVLPNVPSPLKRILSSSTGRAAVRFVVSGQRVSDLHHLEVQSGIALALMAIISGFLGWLVAGRVLRPLRTITATTQEISEASLDRRLAMGGPRDELRQLADTIDGLLQRMEGAFDAQRRFVANASHELRTPLTAARALLEMVLSDQHASVETFREICQEVLKENEYQEQLIDGLLTLAQGQRRLEQREPVDLAEAVSEELRRQRPDATARGLDLHVSLEPSSTFGDKRLLRRLVSNLFENAIRHNTPGGEVQVAVRAAGAASSVEFANTGPVVPAAEIDRLVQPFQRLAPDRTGHGDGLGLGLSIVAAIAAAHDASLEIHPREGGGLRVTVRFPRAPVGNSLALPRDATTEAMPLAQVAA
jgi:signal transduction histidine kinase